MSLLDHLIPQPRLAEVDHVDVTASPGVAWARVRHGDLGSSPLIRGLFALRTLPARLHGRPADTSVLTIDAIVGADAPGFRLLGEEAHEVAVGAIGQVWHLDIPFVDVRTADGFAAFDDPGYVKVAWALRVLPRGDHQARVEVEVRVAATSEEAWTKFRRYFLLVGPGSRFIRRQLVASVGRELGTSGQAEPEHALPGDELLRDAAPSLTHAITIHAAPDAVWPWLVQMGCGRAGWYSYDRLDNAGIESARTIRPELQAIRVGDVLPATPGSADGFEVLRLEPPRLLVLGGLFDADTKRQLPFAAPRPAHYWHVTWAFVLEAPAPGETRLIVRARAAFQSDERLHALWIRPVHHFMQARQLHNLKARAEAATRDA